MDNLITAIIALFSGTIGAVIALIGNQLVSKRAAETQVKMAVLKNFMDARLSAYQEFLTALQIWSERLDGQSCANLYCAAGKVALVASDETIAALANVQSGVRLFETDGFIPKQPEWGELIVALEFSMHSDLTSYRVPEIKV